MKTLTMKRTRQQGRTYAAGRNATGWVLALLLVAGAATQRLAAQSVIGGFGMSSVAGGGTTPATCSGSTDAFGDGCLATQAVLNSPQRVAFDAAGNMYIADVNNNLIRMVSATTGIITVVAGGGTTPTTCSGSTDAYGDGCAPTQAKLNGPQGMLFDPQGNLYVVDRVNFAIRKITNPSTGTGVITTIAGKIGSSGTCATTATAANLTTSLLNPKEIAFDTAGNMYVSQNGANCWGVVVIANASGTPATFTPGALSKIIGVVGCTVTGITNPSAGTAAAAQSCSVDGVVADKLGNIFLTLSSGFGIAEISGVASKGTNAPITLIAGTINTAGFTGDGGAATSAQIHPESSAVDAFGNVFIGDGGNSRVREIIAATGEIITVAGGGAAPTTCAGSIDTLGDGCAATQATINTGSGPSIGLAFDAAGNLYVADAGNNRIRKLTSGVNFTAPTAAVKATATATLYVETTAATTAAVTAAVSSPSGDFAVGTLPACTAVGSPTIGYSCGVPLTFTPKFAGQRSEPLTVIGGTTTLTTEVTGTGTAPVAGFISPPIASLAATATLLKTPALSAVDTDGNLYIADTGNNLVRKVTSAGVASVVSTGTTTLNAPRGVAVDGLGNLYIADTGNNVVRRVTPTGTLTTIAGTGTAAYTGDYGLATAAALNAPSALVADAYGALYIADTGNNVVRKIAGGVIWTMAGGGASPASCPGSTGPNGDGCVAALGKLSAPGGLALDAARNLYIADTGNHAVRKVAAATGLLSVIAGVEGIPGYGGDGLAGTSALLNGPTGIAADAGGNLYIADTGNDVVRTVSGSGVIATLAGTSGIATYTGDGGSAAAATLSAPAGVSVGSSDTVYVIDSGNNAVRTLAMTASAALAFPDTAINSTSNQLADVVENLGNAPLTFTALAFPTYFSQQPTTSTSGVNCGTVAGSGTVTSLAGGASCYLAAVFKPTAIGPQSGNITVTDNTGNVAGSSQTIAVSGKGVAALGVITVSVPTVTYGTASSLTITVSGTGTFPTPTGTVTYAVDGGAASAAQQLTAGMYGPVSLGSLNAGTHMLVVTYSGDATYGKATYSTTFTVTGLAVTLSVVEAPANPAWGNTVTATVTLATTASNTPITGQVTYLLDAATVPFPLTLTNGTGTLPLGNALAVACHTLVVTYGGSTQYSGATQTLNFCVTPSATVTTLTAPATTLYPNNPTTFTATVTSATGASTAGGTVLFQIGLVVICTSTVSSTGTATCTYAFGTAPFSAFGNYTITANFQASTDFSASSAPGLPVTYVVTDFTIIPETAAVGIIPAAPVSAVTVKSGTVTALQVEVQGNNYVAGNAALPGYAGTVNLSCKGLPALMSCVISPASVTLTASSYPASFPAPALSLSVFASTGHVDGFGQKGRTSIVAASLFFPGLLLAGWASRRRKIFSPRWRGGLLLLLLGVSLTGFAGMTGCGYAPYGVAPGTYPITIVGTDATNNIVRSAVLSVTVTH